MSRVLISFLGTGPTERQEYRMAKYHFDSDVIYETPFVAAALQQYYNVDRIILIGTMKSMWDCVYDYFGNKNGIFDGGIWEKLYENRLVANHETPVGEICCQRELEATLGNGSKVILTHYGLNNEEIEQNSNIIIGLEQYLEENDELIIDITHAFRSLPMYMMNLIIYLQNVSEKRLKISHICYGMLDVTNEFGYTPVVELNTLLSVNDWISGAYSFKMFGNAYKIATLIDGAGIEHPRKFSNPLRVFTDAKNLNHLAELENQVQKLQVLRNTDNLPSMARMVVDPVVGEFLKTVKMGSGKFRHSDFQYQLAIWQQSNHNYAAAYISLHEAILTRACELVDFDSSDYTARENMKCAFRWARGGYGAEAAKAKLKDLALLEYLQEYRNGLKPYANIYKKVGENRNAIAHCLKDQNGRITNTVSTMIQNLKQFIKDYKDQFLC